MNSFMRKILIIDDQKNNLIALRALLKNHISNCVVITAESGTKGIDLAKKEQPDTILLDIFMPVMDGFEVCKILKSDNLTKHIPIIMLTAVRKDSESRITGLNSGAEAFISKPIDTIELVAQINVMFRIKDAEDSLRQEKENLEELVLIRTKQLEESEKQYRNLFENNHSIMLFIDPESGNIIEANKAANKFYGYTKKEFKDLNISNISTLSKNETDIEIKKAFSNRKTYFNAQHQLKNGEIREVEIHSDKLIWEKKPLLYSIIYDITEKKEIEKKLKEQGTFVDQSPAPVFSIDYNGKLLAVNKSAKKVSTKFSEGKSIYEIFNKLDKSSFETLNQSKTYQFVELINTKTYLFTAIKNEDYKTIYFYGADITKRTIIEQKLKDTAFNLNKSQNIAKIGSYVLNIEKGTWEGSEYLDIIFGLNKTDLKTVESWVDLIHPDDQKMMADYFTNNVLKNHENFNKEYRIINKKTNKEYWVHGLGKLEFDKQGNPVKMIGTIQNISDRLKTEESIRSNEQKMSLHFNQTPVGIIEWDLDFNVINWNSSAGRIFGYSKKEAIGKHATFLLNENQHNLIDQMWNDLISHKGGRRNTNTNIRKNGEQIICEWYTTPLVDEHGNVIAITSIIEDITDRVKAEQVQKIIYKISNTIITSEKIDDFIQLIQFELGKIIDTKNFYIAFYDEETDYFTSPYYSDEEDDIESWPAGKSLSTIVIKKSKSVLLKKDEILKMADKGEIDVICTIPESWLGTPLYFENKVAGIFAVQSYDNPDAYDKSDMKILEFISKQISISLYQKKAKEDLIESENRFDLAMKASRDGLYDWDLVNNKVYYSETWKKMLGYENNELPNIIETWEQLSHPKERDASLKKLKNAIKNKIQHYDVEFRMKHKKGHWVNILLRANIIYDKDGNGIRAIGTHSDMTDIKKAEKTLKKALKKARESDRLKSTFLATMSHELRTPLNAIIGFSDIISHEFTIDEILEFNKTINKSGKHLLNIVEDLFDVTLIETGEIKIIKEELDLNSLLNEVHDMIIIEQNKADKKHIEISNNQLSESQNIVIHTDPSKFKQIILNLLKNALKFTHEGFIKYGFEYENIDDKGYLKFYVQDTGIGIPEEKQELIFDIFRQVEDSNTREYGGTGIGLTISKRLTELLGGEMWLHSEEGIGTIFYFTIPYKQKKFKEDDSIISVSSDILKTDSVKTVLIVEDMQSSYEYLHVVLTKLGLKTLWAENGKIAIEICKKNNEIDLVLMDINMPVMNGFDATKTIKKIKPNLPIIAQTAYAIQGDTEKSLEAGCNDYISKPIRKGALISLLKKYIK